jgi:exopolysaccharide biosynthesis polyprenyl glycosylphosphotransferase
MLRERAKLIVQAHKIWDICLTAAAFIVAYFIKKYMLPMPFHGLTTTPNYYIILLLVIIIWYATFSLFNLYVSYRKRIFLHIFWDMVKAVSTAILFLILCMYIFKITDVSRIMMGLFFFLNIGLLALSKGIVYKVLSQYRNKGFNFRNIIIVGSKERAKDIIDAIGDRLSSGYRVMGCLEINDAAIGEEVKNGIKVIGIIDHLGKILREKVVDELIFAMSLKKIQNASQYIATAEEMGIQTRIIPDWQIYKLMYKPEIASIRFEEFLGIPTMALSTTPTRPAELLIKSAFDYACSGIVLILLSPVFLVISLIIKLSSKGPVFYKQERSGVNGRKFMVYKFRTMVADAEARRHELDELNEADGPVFKINKDPRIIPYIGTFMRKTSVDELPQLINVFKGEMSVVGPRPPIPAEVEKYDLWQRRRLSMKPGLTCLWQITPNRNEINFEEWMKMDLKYIDEWSLWLDFKILLKTAWVIFIGAGR